MFMIAMVIALVGYTVFPTAPPRFMPEWGFIDSVSDFTGVHVSHASASMSALFNPYAAVPSMHVAFALMIGWPLARLARQRVVQRAVVPVPVPDGVRDRRHRQPLHLRRAARRAHRRRLGLRRDAGWRGRGRRCGASRAASAGPRAERRGERRLAARRTTTTMAPRRHALAARAARASAYRGAPAPRARADRLGRSGASSCATALIESRLTPNAISLTGLALNLVAAVLVWEQLFFLGGVAFIVGSVMDTLDGRYSRMSGKGTPFGAFLDSTLDRIEEGIVLTAVAGYFALQGNRVAAAAVVVAVLASLMVSYTRARAEALGVECKVGIATRPVRVVILSIGLLFAKGASLGDFELLEPGRVRARRAQRDHRRAAHLRTCAASCRCDLRVGG